MKKQTIAAVIMMTITLILAILSFVILPPTVVTQLSRPGSSPTTMPRFLAVLIPSVLGIGGSLAGLSGKSEKKWYIISGVGILVFLIMFIVNL